MSARGHIPQASRARAANDNTPVTADAPTAADRDRGVVVTSPRPAVALSNDSGRGLSPNSAVVAPAGFPGLILAQRQSTTSFIKVGSRSATKSAYSWRCSRIKRSAVSASPPMTASAISEWVSLM